MKTLRNLIFGLLGLMYIPIGMSQDVGEELLEPEVAFAASVAVLDDQTLAVRFNIAEGYYLYRQRFNFTSEQATLGTPVIPPGKKKVDEFFGEVETYRENVTINLPFTSTYAPGDTFDIEVTSQGCADIGVCYPPLKQTLAVNLPAQSIAEESSSSTLSSLLNLGGSFGMGGDEDELLDPDDAFALAVSPVIDGAISLQWTIADTYFMYRDKMQFELQGAAGAVLGDPQLPAGKVKNDEFFGISEVYRNTVTAQLPIDGLNQASEAVLHVTYQGCADIGVCYPPIKKQIPVNLTPSSNQANTLASVQQTTRPVAEQDRIAASLASGDTLLTILTFYGLGLLLAFTPCVFPMVPILSSIIVGQGENITTRRAFGLSLVYVLSMALTYTAAGVAVGLSGENIQVWFQTPWVLISFAVLFALLSLSMFGFYELQVPAAMQSKLTKWSNSQQGGTLLGVSSMGFLSALIVGPCITAPLVGALIYIAETGDAVLGGAALFALSMGMGFPLLVIGTSAGTLLPKAGAWMDAVKSVFGVLLLALGIWMLERILPLSATMALSALLLISSAVYMGALEPLRERAAGWLTLWKSLGIAIFAYGLMLAIGAAAGGTSFIHPLKGVIGSSISQTSEHIQFEQIKGVDGLSAALDRASANNQTVMLDFYADWCISCKEMEAFTFSDPKVQLALKNTVLLQADVTPNDELDKQLLKEIGIFGPPAILFYDKRGEEIANARVVGFVPADEFANHVNRTINN